jgi:hypothetical protein
VTRNAWCGREAGRLILGVEEQDEGGSSEFLDRRWEGDRSQQKKTDGASGSMTGRLAELENGTTGLKQRANLLYRMILRYSGSDNAKQTKAGDASTISSSTSA